MSEAAQHLDDQTENDEAQLPELPDPEKAPIKELTSYCRATEQWPENWTKMKAKEKRREFRRLFAPEASETFNPNDPLHLISERVENLEQEQALEAIKALTEDVGMNYFELGGVLNLVTKKAWFSDLGHDTFKSFVETTTDMKYGKARYLVRVYTKCVELEIPWAKLGKIGWSKIVVLLDVLTQENADEWLAKAESLSRRLLAEEVARVKRELAGEDGGGEDGGGEGGEGAEEKMKQLSFRLYEGQLETVEAALDEMGRRSGKENRSVQLEFMCADWLSGQGGSEAGEENPDEKVQTLNDVAAEARVLFERAKELGSTDFEALTPIVETLDALFPNAKIDVTADGAD